MEIRNVSHKDVNGLVDLLCELGYPLSNKVIEKNLTTYLKLDGYEVLVAEHEDKIVGFLSLHLIELFHMEGSSGRITSLIVSPDTRGIGVGKALIKAADKIFKKMGCVKAEVISADHRKDAHIFYQSQGYILDKKRFIKIFET